MAQIALDFDPGRAPADAGFAIGWDHAHHGLVPPHEQMYDGSAVQRGWLAGRQCFRDRQLTASVHTRRWLRLRLDAWLHGQAIDSEHLSANHLRQIDATHCPVLRVPLHGEGVPQRARNDAAWACGNVLMLHPRAARARGTLGWADAWARARSESHDGLARDAWQRLAVLMSFVTPLPHEQAAALPLLALPTNRLRVLNAAQGLQVLVTLTLCQPLGSQRLHRLTDTLAAPLRHDVNRCVSALLPRVLDASRVEGAAARRCAVEDAWRDPLVMRRWASVALPLGEAGCDALLRRAEPTRGAHTRWLPRDAATDGWALGSRARAAVATPAPSPAVVPLRPWSWPAVAAPRPLH